MIVWYLTIFALNINLLLPVKAVDYFESRAAKPGEADFVVSLQDRIDSFHFCGGTAVTPRHVLTAGHCAFNLTAEAIKAVVGSYTQNPAGYSHLISYIHLHPSYDHTTLEYDIAIMETATDMMVPLARLYTVYINGGENAVLFGFGCDFNIWTICLSTPNEMRRTNTNTLDNSDRRCNEDPASKRLCTWSSLLKPLDENGNGCYGDSGGPLTIYKPFPREYIQIGIVSSGFAACKDVNGMPASRYTRVSSFMPFIRRITGNTTLETDTI